MKKIALVSIILLSAHLCSAVKVYTPFYDSYQKSGKNGSKMVIPQGKYRTGWRAGRHRAYWHDKYPSQVRREK